MLYYFSFDNIKNPTSPFETDSFELKVIDAEGYGVFENSNSVEVEMTEPNSLQNVSMT